MILVHLIFLNVLVLVLNVGLVIIGLSNVSPFGLAGPDLMRAVFSLFASSVAVWFLDLFGLLLFGKHKGWRSVKVLASFFIVLSIMIFFMMFFITGQ